MFVLYASNPISSQDRYENKDEKDGKGSQGKTDGHKDTHYAIEKIEDWQPNRGEERGYGYGYFELVRYVYHSEDTIGCLETGVNQSGKEPESKEESEARRALLMRMTDRCEELKSQLQQARQEVAREIEHFLQMHLYARPDKVDATMRFTDWLKLKKILSKYLEEKKA
jgi:hypothetical protein